MIEVTGSRVKVSGPMIMTGASVKLAEGESALAGMSVADLALANFDLGAVTEMDSSCLAVVFGWMRAAKARGAVIRLSNVPGNLLNLAEVYGVTELLPQS